MPCLVSRRELWVLPVPYKSDLGYGCCQASITAKCHPEISIINVQIAEHVNLSAEQPWAGIGMS